MAFIVVSGIIGFAVTGWLLWTAWSERGERNRTSHEGSRTSVGRRW